jgi:release factor glutamine methyltransferase
MCRTDASLTLASVTGALRAAGCVAADEEAEELIEAASGRGNLLQGLERRLSGEPLAWITGRTRFCGIDVSVGPGVYVPRWQSEPLAIMAAQLLPHDGVGVELCTGSGAVALVMQAHRPDARVVATEMDGNAARCARRNGVTVYEGDLDEPLPRALMGRVDVMVGVLPYVPTDALHLLPRDVQQFEPRMALDGGDAGLAVMARAVVRTPRWLKSGGWVLFEIGGDQVDAVTGLLSSCGFRDIGVLEDGDRDPRAICGRLELSPGDSGTDSSGDRKVDQTC